MRISRVLVGAMVWLAAALAMAGEQASSAASSAEPLLVRHPYNTDGDPVYDWRDRYLVALLDLALSHSGEPYRLQPVPLSTVNANRNSRNLSISRYNVNWMHTNPDREKTLWPVRVPLFKGLTGWRLLVIRSDRADEFARIDSLAGLKSKLAGQGHSWPDTEILKRQGFAVETSVSRRSLVSMLKGERIDYFPRSVMEIWDELALYGISGSIMVEPHLALVYPTAYYFFVQKGDRRLHRALQVGLERARADGSFDRLFWRYYAKVLRRARLSERRVFRLPNPLNETLPTDPALWFDPANIPEPAKSQAPADY